MNNNIKTKFFKFKYFIENSKIKIILLWIIIFKKTWITMINTSNHKIMYKTIILTIIMN